MNEFELQGDISSGFRWCGKGVAEVKREAFVPLGDSSGAARIQNNKKRRQPSEEEIASDPRYDRPYSPLKRQPSGTATDFDLDYDLLLATEREARRQLLAPWSMIPLACLKKLRLDPYVAHELHRQELRDKELRDVVNALFGKAGDWRVARIGEARHNDYAWGLYDHIAADGDDTREVDRFLQAFKAIVRLKKNGPVKTAKAWALHFVLRCRVKGEPLPTKGEVLRFLESNRIPFVKKNAWRDIFTGPILCALLRGRVGRPRKTRQAQGK